MLFNIFKNKKELHAPALGEMWVCTFDFYPWNEDAYKVFIKKVNIISATADSKGIMVRSSEPYPFDASSISNSMYGYIGKFTNGWRQQWTGFFETEEEAKKAFNDLMIKWCDILKSKIVNI